MPQSPDDEVRRRLTAARADGPPPPEVVERLDRVLADLHTERVAAAEADDLAERRRRRRRTVQGLVAAAAVVAVIGGAGPVLRSLGSLSDSATSGGTTSDSADGAGAGAEAAPGTPLPFIRPAHARTDIAVRVPRRLRAQGDPAACVVPDPGRTAVAVSYGGRWSALVFAAPAGGRQRVTVYACDGVHGGTRLRTLTVPAPTG